MDDWDTDAQQGALLAAVRRRDWSAAEEVAGEVAGPGGRGASQQQRDAAAAGARRHGQWELLSQLVQQGVSQQQRDLAASGQWLCVEQLLAAGVGTEHRELVLRRALRRGYWTLVTRLLDLGVAPETSNAVARRAVGQGQWEAVLAALRVGVARAVVDEVFREVVSQRQWEHVPDLVTLFQHDERADSVVRAAVTACQWDCVLRLVKVGLTPGQQAWVCREALDWSHFDCAIELLRQGIEPAWARRIVVECIKWNRCRDLVEILQTAGTNPSVRDIALGTAKALENWDAYLVILEAIGPTEREMVDVITSAFYAVNVNVILRLISLFASARRVLKHLLLSTRFDPNGVIILHPLLLDNTPDLAFYMFVAQEMWECVVGMYGDARLHARGRGFALRRAVRKGAWESVERMVDSAATSPRDGRHAFLQVARQGQWRLALRLSAQSVKVSGSDRLFCLRTWLKRGQWQCIQDVLGEWDCRPPGKELLLKCVLEESVIAGELDTFLEVCYVMDFDEICKRFVFQTALAHDKCHFILEFYRRYKYDDNLKVALALSIQSKKWTFVKDLVENIDAIEILQLCLQGIWQDRTAWLTVVPALDAFCQRLRLYTTVNLNSHEFVVGSDGRQDARELTEWCLQASHGQLALLLSVMLGDEDLVTRVTDQLGHSIDYDAIKVSFVISHVNRDWGSAVGCLQCLSVAHAEYMIRDLARRYGLDFSDVIGNCRERGLHGWAVYLGVWFGDWDNVGADLQHCQDHSVIDAAIEKAVEEDQWDIVKSHIARGSQDSALLYKALFNVVLAGPLECCKMLVAKVDPLRAEASFGEPLIHDAVHANTDREGKVRLFIEAGLSTHVRSCDCTSQDMFHVCRQSPMKGALTNGQLPLVKLLHKAGACSHKELFRLKGDLDLKARLEGQGRHDIVRYMHEAATTPRSLQDLSRMAVSHLLGCRPGRPERVMSLDVTWPARDLIKFDDVLCVCVALHEG